MGQEPGIWAVMYVSPTCALTGNRTIISASTSGAEPWSGRTTHRAFLPVDCVCLPTCLVIQNSDSPTRDRELFACLYDQLGDRGSR